MCYFSVHVCVEHRLLCYQGYRSMIFLYHAQTSTSIITGGMMLYGLITKYSLSTPGEGEMDGVA